MPLAFKRILLKLSGEALAGDKGFGVETSRIHSIAAVIMKATKVNGIYDADPKIVTTATMIETITYLDVLKRGLRVMDATAISLCQENSLPIVIFNLNVHGNIKRVVTGEKVGSLVSA